jgi:anti-anti-sigma regulatory factor
VIPLAERVLAVPFVGSVDVEHVLAVQDDLLHEIDRRRARIALIDLAGAVEMPAQAVDRFGQLLRAIRVIGCRAVVTGACGQVARALLENGPDPEMETRRDLRAGLTYALSLTESAERLPTPSSQS